MVGYKCKYNQCLNIYQKIIFRTLFKFLGNMFEVGLGKVACFGQHQQKKGCLSTGLSDYRIFGKCRFLEKRKKTKLHIKSKSFFLLVGHKSLWKQSLKIYPKIIFHTLFKFLGNFNLVWFLGPIISDRHQVSQFTCCFCMGLLIAFFLLLLNTKQEDRY